MIIDDFNTLYGQHIVKPSSGRVYEPVPINDEDAHILWYLAHHLLENFKKTGPGGAFEIVGESYLETVIKNQLTGKFRSPKAGIPTGGWFIAVGMIEKDYDDMKTMRIWMIKPSLIEPIMGTLWDELLLIELVSTPWTPGKAHGGPVEGYAKVCLPHPRDAVYDPDFDEMWMSNLIPFSTLEHIVGKVKMSTLNWKSIPEAIFK